MIAAWDWRNGAFTRRWTFDTNSSTNTGKGFDGQGSHSLSVGDVDDDGKDEIVYGAMAVDDNGNGLWTTRTGHGDAQHLGDLDPSHGGPGVLQGRRGQARSRRRGWAERRGTAGSSGSCSVSVTWLQCLVTSGWAALVLSKT